MHRRLYDINKWDIYNSFLNIHSLNPEICNSRFFHYASFHPTGRLSWDEKISYGCNLTTKFNSLPSKHAEIDALFKIIKYRNLPRKIDLVVVRLSKSGIVGESRPCWYCIKLLIKSGLPIKNVYYSTADGNIARENLEYMGDSIPIHISLAFKKVKDKTFVNDEKFRNSLRLISEEKNH